MTEHHNDPLVKTTSEQLDNVGDIERRDILACMGRFAYAAPALALLARPRAAQADYGGARGGDRGAGGDIKGRGGDVIR